jgi:hypothetical protein
VKVKKAGKDNFPAFFVFVAFVVKKIPFLGDFAVFDSNDTKDFKDGRSIRDKRETVF